MSTPEGLRALGHEVRSRIVLLLRERAASTTELAGALGAPKGTVGHHVKVLERAGLIRVVATRQVRAVTERYYGRVARLFVMASDDVGGRGGSFAGMMLRQGADELPAEVPDPTLVTAGLVHARLRPAQARRIIRRLDKLVVDFRELDDPLGEPFGFALGVYPISRALPEEDGDA